MTKSYDCFQTYLEDCEKLGQIEFRLCVVRSPENELHFYIHPFNKDGTTGDFSVNGAFVNPLEGDLAAGSPRPHSGRGPLLGS